MKVFKHFFNKDFLLLWVGLSVSRMGDGAGFIAIMWWVQSEAGALALGALAMAKGLTATLLGPFGGVLADRLDRKVIIVSTDVIRGIIYCLLAYLAATGSLTLPVLIVLSCLSVACGQLFYPAVTASIPLLVPNDGLERANALNQFTRQLVNIAGYAAGGVMVALFGVPMLLIINGLSFLCSAASEMFIVIPRVSIDQQRISAGLFLSDIRDGLNYILKNDVLTRILALCMVLNFFYAPLFVLMPVFVSDHMGADSTVYGYLLSSMMAGGLLGAVILSGSTWVQNNLWLVKWGVTLQGLLLLMMPFLPVHLWLWHIVVLFLSGGLNMIINIYFETLVQRITQPEYMGKVFGLLGTATGALAPVAQGLSGAAASVVKVPFIYAICAGFCTATGVTFPFIRGIDSFMEGSSGQEEETIEPAVPASD